MTWNRRADVEVGEKLSGEGRQFKDGIVAVTSFTAGLIAKCVSPKAETYKGKVAYQTV